MIIKAIAILKSYLSGWEQVNFKHYSGKTTLLSYESSAIIYPIFFSYPEVVDHDNIEHIQERTYANDHGNSAQIRKMTSERESTSEGKIAENQDHFIILC